MAIRTFDEGELALLTYLVADFNGANLFMRLFQNNVTPGDTDVLADFVQADFDGYGDMVMAAWVAAALDGTIKAFTFHPTISFLQTGVGVINDIYGYVVYRQADSKIIFGERDPAAPVAMDAIGKAYNVTVANYSLSNA